MEDDRRQTLEDLSRDLRWYHSPSLGDTLDLDVFQIICCLEERKQPSPSAESRVADRRRHDKLLEQLHECERAEIDELPARVIIMREIEEDGSMRLVLPEEIGSFHLISEQTLLSLEAVEPGFASFIDLSPIDLGLRSFSFADSCRRQTDPQKILY